MSKENNQRFEDYDHVAILFKKLFSTEEGKQVLAVLKTRFEEPSLIPNAVSDGVAMVFLQSVRSGEVNVIRFIDKMINRELGRGK